LLGLVVGVIVGLFVGLLLGFRLGVLLGIIVGILVGIPVLGLNDTGALVVKDGPSLSLHPQETAVTLAEQNTVTLVLPQNASGSPPSTSVPTKVNSSRDANKFPNSVGIVPSNDQSLVSLLMSPINQV
jgi:hypothetical protein